jgi:hypothetical protein
MHRVSFPNCCKGHQPVATRGAANGLAKQDATGSRQLSGNGFDGYPPRINSLQIDLQIDFFCGLMPL